MTKLACNETAKCRGKVVVTFKFRGFNKSHCLRHWAAVSVHAMRETTDVVWL